MTEHTPTSCANWESLSRLLPADFAHDQRSHVAKCPHCGPAYQQLELLRSLGRQLPSVVPEPDRVAALSAQTLQAIATSEAKRRRAPTWWKLGAAAAVFLVGTATASIHFFSSSAPSDTFKVMVQGPGATYGEFGPPQDRLVRLSQGSITVEVEHLHPGQRFRVVTGDAEVEVRGTAFDVVAENDHLTRVRVLRGRVEVRPLAAPLRLLGPGERWDAAVTPPVPSAVASTRPPDPLVPEAGPPTPLAVASTHVPAVASPRSIDEAEQAFKQGWSAMRRGDYAVAIKEFDRSLSYPNGRIAEDAQFSRAVALSRAGNAAGAMTALVDFLRRHPNSSRRGECSLLLGHLEVQQGNLTSGRRHLEAASKDPSPAVRERAERELARLSSR